MRIVLFILLIAIIQCSLIRSEIIEIQIETKIVKTYSANSNILLNSRILEAIRQIDKIQFQETKWNNIFHNIQQWLMDNFNFNSFRKSRQTAYLDGLI